jgi:hypothetical protein
MCQVYKVPAGLQAMLGFLPFTGRPAHLSGHFLDGSNRTIAFFHLTRFFTLIAFLTLAFRRIL